MAAVVSPLMGRKTTMMRVLKAIEIIVLTALIPFPMIPKIICYDIVFHLRKKGL
jgi:hypothetical protein